MEDDRGVARADWPCSGLQFNVINTGSSASSFLNLKLNLGRVRVHVEVSTNNNATTTSTILEGNTIYNHEKNYEIPLLKAPPGSMFRVELTKLTQASPYMNGLGKPLTSIIEFHGIEMNGDLTLAPFKKQQSQLWGLRLLI